MASALNHADDDDRGLAGGPNGIWQTRGIVSVLASIPSPSSPLIFDGGPIALRWYGVLLAGGILVAIWITRRQFTLRGLDPTLVASLAVWLVPFGVVGARLYHVVTDWDLFSGHLDRLLTLQQKRLGMYGAVLGGAIGAIIASRRLGLRPLTVLDCIVPGVALAQAIGRFGNYANQELFDGPTNLPWGLEIDPANRPAGYAAPAFGHDKHEGVAQPKPEPTPTLPPAHEHGVAEPVDAHYGH